jgi:lipopolysaccharide export system protein LptA
MLELILRYLIFSIFFSTSCAKAGYSEKYDDITINSHDLVVNKSQNKSYFYGKVILWCGDLILKTEELVLEFSTDKNGKKELNRMIIPKKLSAIKQDLSSVIIADEAEYDNPSGVLLFKGKVYLQNQDKVVRCDELTYLVSNTNDPK